jgi:Asp/Glu/hydantoin racemase
MALARGGQAVYGAALGILMLDARFARVPGDMGNATTWPFPVHYRVVRGASPERVVLGRAAGLLQPFLDAAGELVAMGAAAITTNCGFLSLFQRELAAHVGVPVATSALMQVPWVQATLPPGRRVGVVTISAASLSPSHLAAAGVPLGTPIAGCEDGRELFPVLIRGQRQDLDTEAAEQDVLDAARRLTAAHPEVGAIVLECTNMPPYAAAVAEATGLPVFDAVTLVHWLHGAIRPHRFSPGGAPRR